MDVCSLLYLKWTTNRALLYGTGNSAPCYAAAWMRRELSGEWIHIVYVGLRPFSVHLELSQHWLLTGYIPQYKIKSINTRKKVFNNKERRQK